MPAIGPHRRHPAGIAGELVERDDGLVDLAWRIPVAELPAPRLLGAFEPLLLGWRSREPLLGDRGGSLVTVNGIFRPFALVRGRAAATWSLRDGGLAIEPFGRLARADRDALEEDGRAVARYLRVS